MFEASRYKDTDEQLPHAAARCLRTCSAHDHDHATAEALRARSGDTNGRARKYRAGRLMLRSAATEAVAVDLAGESR